MMHRQRRYRAVLVSHLGTGDPVTASRLRRAWAGLAGCSPFEVPVQTLHRGPDVRLFKIGHGDLPGEAIEELLPVAATGVDASFSPLEERRLYRHATRALRALHEARTHGAGSRLLLGRPPVMAADVWAGACRLHQFCAADWQVFRFPDLTARRRAYACYRWGQQWLQDVCDHLGMPVLRRPGCVVSLSMGRVVG